MLLILPEKTESFHQWNSEWSKEQTIMRNGLMGWDGMGWNGM